MRRHKMNFTAFLIVVVITFVFILPVIGGLADDGFFKDIWLDVIEAIPFGSFVGEAVVKVFQKSYLLQEISMIISTVYRK